MTEEMERSNLVVLDASAFIQGGSRIVLPLSPRAITVPGVKNEVFKHGDAVLFSTSMDLGLRVMEPSQEAKDVVALKAESLGLADKLSEVDKDLAALAYEHGARLYSDDYALQNLCEDMEVKWKNVSAKGITEVNRYANRCTGCGRYFKAGEAKPGMDCPICGHHIRTVRSR